MSRKYKIIITAAARHMLKEIKDRRVLEKIGERIDDLSREPEKQGKPLIDELAGCRSLRAAGQRYRIIYRVEQDKVFVLALGIRKEGSPKDIYQLAKRLLKLKLVE